MAQLWIDFSNSRPHFEPGDVMTGTARWRSRETVGIAELHLLWTTRGRGEPETQVAAAVRFLNPQLDDERTFRIQLPQAPYSFTGKLFSLVWLVRLTLNNGVPFHQEEIIISPTRSEIRLDQL